jgi:hypothetical protein
MVSCRKALPVKLFHIKLELKLYSSYGGGYNEATTAISHPLLCN